MAMHGAQILSVVKDFQRDLRLFNESIPCLRVDHVSAIISVEQSRKAAGRDKSASLNSPLPLVTSAMTCPSLDIHGPTATAKPAVPQDLSETGRAINLGGAIFIKKDILLRL